MEIVNYDLLRIPLVPLKISDVTGDDGLWNVCKQPSFGGYYEFSLVQRLVLLEISWGKSYLPPSHRWEVYISGAKGWYCLFLPHTLYQSFVHQGTLKGCIQAYMYEVYIVDHSGTWPMGLGRFWRVYFWKFCDQRDKNSGFKACGLRKCGLRESGGTALCF